MSEMMRCWMSSLHVGVSTKTSTRQARKSASRANVWRLRGFQDFESSAAVTKTVSSGQRALFPTIRLSPLSTDDRTT
jgi:hypothetical protein